VTPAEVQAAFEAFALLEPEIQKGIAGLIHLFHKSPTAQTAQDFIALAQQYIADLPK
jgi:hypothetical protein